MTIFHSFAQNLQRYYVFDIKYKNKSLFMKFLGFLLFFNKSFMSDYTTTIGNTIYFPSEEFVIENEKSSIVILAHEVVHIAQSEKYGKFLFSLIYLFPQCLALFALGAIFAVFWLPMLWCLLFLIFIAPIPAPWRARFEFDGYSMSLFMNDVILKHQRCTPESIKRKLCQISIRMDYNNFKGPNYWFMWPFGLEKEFENIINDISNGVILDTDEVYDRVKRSYLSAVTAYDN
jgi:hypothetical protein